MSTDGQGTKCGRNIAENYNGMSKVHERYRRQTTDGRAAAYSEPERERKFTFAKNDYATFIIIRLHHSTTYVDVGYCY